MRLDRCLPTARRVRCHVRYLEALLAMECEERDRDATENRIRDAQLPRVKALEDFDFAQSPQIPAARVRELAEGGYIERSEPIVLIGEPPPRGNSDTTSCRRHW
jgi:DNA replication protein DnaC